MNTSERQVIEMPYTICFCTKGDALLMIYRYRPPNLHRWNGIGGKIEAGETPGEAVAREVMEEANIDVHKAQSIFFSGIVTWNETTHHSPIRRGMYAYVIDFPDTLPVEQKREIPEGILAWKPIPWACDANNKETASNLHTFLPSMLARRTPMEYACYYEGTIFKNVTVQQLPGTINLDKL